MGTHPLRFLQAQVSWPGDPVSKALLQEKKTETGRKADEGEGSGQQPTELIFSKDLQRPMEEGQRTRQDFAEV